MEYATLITAGYEARSHRPGIVARPRFHPTASPANIAGAEAQLDSRLPESLRSLLLETDGVMEMLSIDGGEWFESCWVVWPLEEIVRENHRHRAEPAGDRHGRNFRRLLFFGTAGCDGILFGFPVADERACAPNVVAWYPMGDRVTELEPSLEAFLTGWVKGATSV